MHVLGEPLEEPMDVAQAVAWPGGETVSPRFPSISFLRKSWNGRDERCATGGLVAIVSDRLAVHGVGRAATGNCTILVTVDGARALITNDNDRLATDDKMLDAAVENLSSMRCFITNTYDVRHLHSFNRGCIWLDWDSVLAKRARPPQLPSALPINK
jgi:hypothetical protein